MTTTNNLLFVDDESSFLSMIKRNFLGSDYNLFCASTAKEALDIIRNNRIKVLITDLKMPEINGMELVEIVEKSHKNIVKIVLTGDSQVTDILATINHANIFRYIVKPVNFKEELFPIVQEACHIYNINSIKTKLLMEKKLEINKNTPDLPLELLNSLFNSSLESMDVINSILKKAPFLEKESLQKTLLDALSRLEVLKDNIQTVEKIVNNKE